MQRTRPPVDETPTDRDGTVQNAAPAPGAEPSAGASDLRASILYCLKVFLGVRFGLGLLALIGVALLQPNNATSVPGWSAPELTGGWHNLFTAWERWDALWFLRIASQGYGDGDLSAAFFPLYPLLIRGLGTVLGGHPLAAALIISNVAFLGALVALFELTKDEFNEHIARRTVLYIAIFPTSYFFLAPYTESLFLLLAVSSLLAARRRRWEFAGVCGALAAATRSIGIVLLLPLALQAFEQYRSTPRPRSLRALIPGLAWSSLVATGTGAYLLFWHNFNGDWLTPLNDQNGWLREFSPPWESVTAGTREAFKFIGTYSGGYHQLDWILVMVGLGAALWVARHARLPYVAYTFASLLVPLSFIFGGRPFMSMPRFLLLMFPLFWAMAHVADRYRAHEAVVATSAALLGVMTVLFVNWYFVF